MSVWRLLGLAIVCWSFYVAMACGQIYRWIDQQVIPGTENVVVGPAMEMSQAQLTYADFKIADLTDGRFSGAELSFANFQAADLTRVDFRNANLGRANLRAALLEDAEIAGAFFSHPHGAMLPLPLHPRQIYSTASYRRKDLSGVNFQGLNLSGWDFSGQNLTGVKFHDSVIDGANFSDSIIQGVQFGNVAPELITGTRSFQQRDLSGVQATMTAPGLKMPGMQFANGHLVGNFEGADLSGWNGSNAAFDGQFSGADFSGLQIPSGRLRGSFERANFSGANLNGADLSGDFLSANFSNVDFRTIGFHSAQMRRLNLRGANLEGLNLELAILSGDDWQDANIRGLRMPDFGSLSREQLASTSSFRTKTLGAVRFRGADFSELDFSSNDLANADLTGTTLNLSDFSFADLRGAQLGGIVAQGSRWLRADLSGADLAIANLENASFVDANLQNGNLTIANLTNADLRNANLLKARLESVRAVNAKFSGVSLANSELRGGEWMGAQLDGIDATGLSMYLMSAQGANFSGAKLTGSTMDASNYTDARFVNADLSSSSLRFSNFTNVDWSGAKLHSVTATQTSFTNGRFVQADLTRAVLNGSDLSNVNFSQATLVETDLRDVRFQDAQLDRVNLQSAKLQGANLSKAELSQVNAKQTNFSEATLVNANLRDSLLDGADFSRATLTGANFRGAHVTGALFANSNLSCGQLMATATYQQKTLGGISLRNTTAFPCNLIGQDLRGAELGPVFSSDLSGALIEDAELYVGGVNGGLTQEQLYSTASYQSRSLKKTRFVGRMEEWNLSQQDLSEAILAGVNLTRTNLRGAILRDASFSGAELDGADLTDADIVGASFARTSPDSAVGIERWLYATRSYRDRDLRGLMLDGNDLTNLDLSNQNLREASLWDTKLQGIDLRGADLRRAVLGGTGFEAVRFDSATVYDQYTFFPVNFDPTAAGLRFVQTKPGDLDSNGLLDHQDYERLETSIRQYDLNQDGVGDELDVDYWVRELFVGRAGDANFDRSFTSADLVRVFVAGEYEDGRTANSSWTTGDWNHDREFNSADLVAAFSAGGYEESPPAGRIIMVPEPTTFALVFTSLAFMIARKNRSWGKVLAACLIATNLLHAPTPVSATIYRLDGTRIEGTESITLGPGVVIPEGSPLLQADFRSLNLEGSQFTRVNASQSDFTGTNLRNASLWGDFLEARFLNADLSGATLTGAFLTQGSPQLTAEQFYSTANYNQPHLSNIAFIASNLSGWNWSNKQLSTMSFVNCDLRDASFVKTQFQAGVDVVGSDVTGADFTDASFSGIVLDAKNWVGFSKNQFASTASFKSKNLTLMDFRNFSMAGISMQGFQLKSTRFEAMDLANVKFDDAQLNEMVFVDSPLAGSTWANAKIAGTWFSGSSSLTTEQLYSTASYQQRNLQGIRWNTDLSGWNFVDQDLSDSSMVFSNLENASFQRARLDRANLTQVNAPRVRFDGMIAHQADLSRGQFPEASFVGADLSGVILAGAVLSHADLSSANGSDAYLPSTNLKNAIARNSVWDNATWIGVDATGTDLTGASFRSARLGSTDFRNATLKNVDWTGADLSYVQFGSADFRGANLKDVNLTCAFMDELDLQGANLTGATIAPNNWSSTRLIGAEIVGASFGQGCSITPLTQSHILETASVTRGDLRGVKFNYINLENWGFLGMDLTGAGFVGSRMVGTRLDGAKIENADFSSSIANGFTSEQFYATRSYQERKLNGIRLQNNDLSGWNFVGQELADANFSSTILTGTDFTSAQLPRSRFESAQPINTNFTRANLRGAILTVATDSIFRDADLTDALIAWNAFGSDFTNATINGAKIANITWEQFRSTASYRDGNLERIHLPASIDGWDLSGLDLRRFTSETTSLSNARLRNTNLSYMRFREIFGADITGAEIEGTVLAGLTAEQFYSTSNYQNRSLRYSRVDVGAGWNLAGMDLTGSTLSFDPTANVTDAVIDGAYLGSITESQLQSTRSYQQKRLVGIVLSEQDLTGWNLSGQDLTGASFLNSILNMVDFSDSVVRGATLQDAVINGFRAKQLYSTASYQQRDLRDIVLSRNHLVGWNFRDQDLSNASFYESNITNADFTGAKLVGASFLRATGPLSPAILEARAVVLPDGNIRHLDLFAGERFVGGGNLNVTESMVIDQDARLEPSGTMTFSPDAEVRLGGTLRAAYLAAYKVDDAGRFNDNLLFEWPEPLTPENRFARIELPARHEWDISELYTRGIIRAVREKSRGDFDGDGSLDVDDVHMLAQGIRDGWDRSFSVASEFQLPRISDLLYWVEVLRGTSIGDSNLDGKFDSADLVAGFVAGEYEDAIPLNSQWSEGDWDGNGEFESNDLLLAFQRGAYDDGAQARVAAVPEPCCVGWLVAAGIVMGFMRRSRSIVRFYAA